MKNIAAVIFDLGRVLVDISTTGKKFSRLMNLMGFDPEEAMRKYWNCREVRQHMTGEITSHEFYAAARERFNLPLDYADFAEGWCDLFTPNWAMREIFEDVSERYAVGILSDTDPLHWGRIRELAPWLDKAAAPTLSHEVGQLKPHPLMFSRAAENCGRAPEECLFIDDLLPNADGARDCGMAAIHFTGAENLRLELAELGIPGR